MMKMICLFLAIFWGSVTSSFAQSDPRPKVMLTTAAYGTVGGALLGTASMAFGTTSRAIFQGASLGLYAGLLFGGYIIWSYSAEKKAYNTEGQYPDDPESPYNTEDSDGSGGISDADSPYQRGLNPVPHHQHISFEVPLIHIRF